MKPVKDTIDISFAKGLDTKTDPKRVSIGNFSSLQNSVFQKNGQLQKRNGYARLASLPVDTYSFLTTFNGNLTAFGENIAAYSDSTDTWVTKGDITPIAMETLSIVRNNLNQTSCDSAVSENGLVCTVYTETDGATTTNKYVIADVETGQNIVAPSVIPVSSGTVSGGMRVFVFRNFFVLMFKNTIAGTAHLQYVRISLSDTTSIGANTDIAASIDDTSHVAWDAFVADSKLFVAYNTISGGQAIKVTYLSSSFVVAAPQTFSASRGDMLSVTADMTGVSPIVWVSWYRANNGFTAAVDSSLNVVTTPQNFVVAADGRNITSAAQNGVVTIFMEFLNAYSYNVELTNFVKRYTVTQAGSVSSTIFSIRSVGLASKSFIVDEIIYYLAAYQSDFQPTFFLVNGSASTSANPIAVAKLAYQNGAGYLPSMLPSATLVGTTFHIPYLLKTLIQAVNKETNVAAGTQVDGIYAQIGISLCKFNFTSEFLNSAEIGSDLQFTGGFLGMYDGFSAVENGFFLYPDNVDTQTITGSGSLTAQDYYYVATYEWSDNQGNIFRSAPSIPVLQITTTASSHNLIHVPTLRVTAKIQNPVKIVIYRWSTAQQIYYQVTSITSPLLNDPTVDSVTFDDTQADSTIIGNNILYTNGGVLENIAPPATNVISLFDNRLWLLDAENPNLWWFSKPVIQSTPVEMSDLQTYYVAPSTAAQGVTGPIRAAAPMDDKFIQFKRNAIYYTNGTGPNILGANSQYSEPIFITSTVGCTNQRSIVFTPLGLMFQSDKGIWLLDRSLNTTYVGAPVEEFNTATVLGAQTIPETNQVRFIMSSGVTLMYDYYYDQWGTFVGVPALSSCVFEERHSFINRYGQVYQENPGFYIDGSVPVLMQFTTGPIRLGELQSYQRAFELFLLGTYLSPHKLYVQIAYDYENAPSQADLLVPDNYSAPYGSGDSQSPYGAQELYGGPGNLERFRVLLQRQRCMAIVVSVQETFDASLGAAAGAGFTLSGLSVVCGFKSKWATIQASKTYG